MTSQAELAVILRARDRYSKELQTAQQGFSGFAKQVLGVGAALGVANIGAAGMIRTLKGLTIDLVNAASDAVELKNKFDATFGESAVAARKELEQFGDEVGRGSQELQRMAADTGAVVKSAGLMEGQAANLSVGLVKLAVDVASFTNAQDDEVLHAFTRALTGEREALKTYGISINQAEVDAAALAMGITQVGAQMSATDKAMVTFQLLLEKTTDSQGDAARTTDEYAGRVKNLRGEIDDLAAALGQNLLPAATETVSVLGDTVFILGEVVRSMQESKRETSAWGQALQQAMVPQFVKNLQAAGGGIQDLADKLRENKTAAQEVDDAYAAWQSDMAALGAQMEGETTPAIINVTTATISAARANDDLALSFMVSQANAQAAAAQYRITTDAAIAGLEREAAARERVTATWDDFRFTISDVGRAIQDNSITTQQILQAIADANRTSIRVVIDELANLGIAANDTQGIIESALGQNAVSSILKLKQAVDGTRQSMSAVAAAAAQGVKGDRDSELGQAGFLRSRIQVMQNEIVRVTNSQSGRKGFDEATHPVLLQLNSQLASFRTQLSDLPGFQTAMGQFRTVPGMMNQPVRAVVHGGEIIGRPGPGMGGEIHIHGDVYGFDDFQRKVAQATKQNRRLGGEV